MIEVECAYEPPHVHTYPDDWIFGGADGAHPAADPRWVVSRYYYFDDRFDCIYVTSTPTCDDEALDDFTRVALLGSDFNPVYIGKRKVEDSTPVMMAFKYDKATDYVTEIIQKV